MRRKNWNFLHQGSKVQFKNPELLAIQWDSERSDRPDSVKQPLAKSVNMSLFIGDCKYSRVRESISTIDKLKKSSPHELISLHERLFYRS
jgi:hypothetical protein